MDSDDEGLAFHEMGLDDRILKSIAKCGWQDPTPIQEKSIPLILEGRDVLARGRTGSGKTACFVLPAVQKILNLKKMKSEQQTRVLIMAPTRELAKQIYQVFQDLTSSCGRVIRVVNVSSDVPVLGDVPDAVVGTPSKVLTQIEAGSLSFKDSLELLVMDEADLIFSFGYENDVKKVLSHLPSTCQAVLTSATLNDDVAKLKGLVLHNPVTLKLEESSSLPTDQQLTQYRIFVEEKDKFVLIYALFKLKLVRGKSIIFVNNVDRCYRLKLYLEQFGIPVCVLNSELPHSSRCHIVTQFNKGVYEVIVASDEKFLDEDVSKDKDKAKSKRKKDTESGVSRGIDFQFVSNIVNFDFPADADSYVHRVGRTARGNNKGTALSLVAAKERVKAEEVDALLKGEDDESLFKPYKFRMEELEGFRYRALDAWQAVTRVAIREARLKEIKQEMLNTAKLQSHFEDNPRDLHSLRHDKALHTVRHQPHLKIVPNYIIPASLRKMNVASGSKGRKQQGGHQKFKPKGHTAKNKFQRQQGDALRSISKK